MRHRTLALDMQHEGGSKEDRRLEEEDGTCHGLKIGQSTKRRSILILASYSIHISLVDPVL